MDALYNATLHKLDLAFERLEAKVPPPQKTPHGNSWVFRYKDKSIHQAMIQKLARQVSGLHAVRLLCEKGLLQEHAAVQRILDELHQDTCFLAYAVIKKEITPLHRAYLDGFYKEELDPTTGDGLLDRPTVSRKKIRAYLSRIESEKDPSSAVTNDHTIYSAHSGFIHGASPQIMEMVGGDPPRFHLHGMAGTRMHDFHRNDLYNPFFRTIVSFALVAKAFGDEDLFEQQRDCLEQIESLSGQHS